MSQKIYADRTKLEGIDLPSAGQTRMLVIDENKNIKSESKSSIPTKTSDLTNDGDGVSRFIAEAEVSQLPVGDKIPIRNIFGRMKAAPGTSSDDVVVKSQLDAQAVGRVRVESYVITLDKAQINNLHTTPISLLWSHMGLTNAQSVRWRPELTAVKIDDDGTPFFGSSPIHVGRFPIQGVISIPPTRYGVSGIYSAFPVQNSVHVGVEPEFYIETGGEITGGGVKSKIEIMLFYEIDTVIF